MSNKSIIQISFIGDKNNSMCYYKEELRKILVLCKTENMMTTPRHKGNSVKIREVEETLKYWSLAAKEVPVESFVGSSTGTHC